MALQVTAIMLAVEDQDRAKTYYGEGMGCTIDKDYPGFASVSLGEVFLALYERAAAAQDAGVSPEGSGFRGVSFHYIVDSREAVDQVLDSEHDGGHLQCHVSSVADARNSPTCMTGRTGNV